MRGKQKLTLQAAFSIVVLNTICVGHISAVTVDWVTIGNPGNTADTETMLTDGTSGYGAVADTYRISKYEVTNSQYVEFLNAKDPTGANTLSLYDSRMTSSSSTATGGINFNSGGANGSKYSVKSGRGNNPVNFVSWYDAIRFANWIHNGQGTGSTETGAYTLGTLNSSGVPLSPPVTHNSGATIWLPTENQWYKAAYYDSSLNSGSGGYWNYPTATDIQPNSDQPPGVTSIQTNVGNFERNDGASNDYNDGFAVTGSSTYSTSQNYLTDVGAYTSALSAYGTFDQGGNLAEWTETLANGTRIIRGGNYNLESGDLHANWRDISLATSNEAIYGFRLAASIPEPSSLTLIVLSGMLFLGWRSRRR